MTVPLADELTTFVGRERELGEIARLLAGEARLVTILGPPGIGKTRTALRAALAERQRATPEVWWCDASEVRSVAELCGAVLTAAGAPGAGGQEPVEGVAAALAGRGRALLLIDNAEGVVADLARCLAVWLPRAPEVKALVTSRERCGVPGEQVVELTGLAVPRPGEAPGGEAVALFRERAKAVRGSGAMDEAQLAAVAEIVRHLEGIPLAIELAAARCRVLTPSQILEQLPRALDVFRRERADGSRHATLRAALDWSWHLLAAWEQDAFAQLSVFRGGLSLEAAEAVVGLSAHGDAPAMIDVLQGLRDKSLLVAADEAAGGERRFRLFALAREYAAEALRSTGGDGSRAAVERHARFFAELGARLAKEMRSAGGALPRARIRLERANLIAAHEWAIAGSADREPSVLLALAILPAIEIAIVSDQPLGEFRLLLDRTVAAAQEAPAQPELLARALLMRMRTSFAEARVDVRDAVRALELLGPEGSAAMRGLASYYGAYAWWYRGDLAEALESFEQAATLFGSTSPPSHLWGHAVADLARLHVERGEHERARDRIDEALTITAQTPDPASQWVALRAAVDVRRAAGFLDDARTYAQRAVALAEQLGEAWRSWQSLHDQGYLARDAGDLEAAARSIAAAEAQLEKIGWVLQRSYHAGRVACLEEEAGRSDRAAELFAVASEAFRVAGFARDHGLLLAHAAVSLAALDRVDEAGLAASRARSVLGDDLAARAAVAFADAHVELARARRADADGDLAAGRRLRAAAETLTATTVNELGTNEAGVLRVPLFASGDLRLLHRRLVARGVTAGVATSAVTLDRKGHSLRAGDRTIALGARPAVRRLLYELAGKPGEVIPRADLARAVWSRPYNPASDDGALKANVRNLRQLLRDTGLDVEFVDDGYRLQAPRGFVVL